MKKKERVAIISKRLNELYPNPKVPLDHKNPFTLLIAVLLSAQSTDKKVNELTKELFSKASSAIEMSKLSRQEIYEHINQLGLANQKAKNIYNLSRILTRKYNQKVPKDINSLETLPGVGHKTASVVMAQAFGIPSFPADTHIHRLAQRWGLTNGKSVKQTEADLKRLFPVADWNKLHLQFIYYGREYCSARGCNGTVCNLCKELYPKRTKPIYCTKA